MNLELPDIVIETLIKALNDGILIQKQARLCDLAALDFIPTEILPHLKLHHQKAIAKAKNALPNILQRKFDCIEYYEDRLILKPPPIYHRILATSSPYASVAIASSIKTSAETLKDLATDPFERIIDNGCQLNSKLKIGYGYLAIQVAVASNPNTPTDILKMLYQEKDIFVCLVLATNPQVPIDILRNLATEENYLERRYILNLKNEPISKVKLKPIKKNFSQHYYSIATDSMYKVNALSMQSSLARNTSTPINILERLVPTKSHHMQKLLVTNPSSTLFILKKLPNSNIKEVKDTTLHRIHSTYQNIAANLETSTEQLQNMLKHQDIEVRLAVTQHPQGLGLLLDRCSKPERCLPEQNSLNRVLAGMHPEISTEQIDNLFNSENWLDRLSVACNSKIHKDYLIQLTQDRNTIVKQTALNILSNQKN